MFSFRNRVRYSEVDPQAVVFNARYLDYADLGITEYYRAMKAAGLWPQGEDPQFHVRHATLDFRRPLFADEEMELRVRSTAFGHTSVTTEVAIHGLDGEPRCLVTTVAVHVDLRDHRPRPLPDWLEAASRAFDGV